MCGVIGLISTTNGPDTPIKIYEGLTFLQHRGQDSVGICNETKCIKKQGLVKNSFSHDDLKSLESNVAMGHVRYGTTGKHDENTIQPIVSEATTSEATQSEATVKKSKIKKISLCHNGNIINTTQITEYITKNFDTNYSTIAAAKSDSAIMLDLFCHIYSNTNKTKDQNDEHQNQIFESIKEMMKLLQGSYSVTMIIEKIGLICFRDPHGIRPLCFGIKDNDYLVSSESVTMEVLDFQVVRDVNPGEIILFEHHNKPRFSQFHSQPEMHKRPCLFEYIYFARIDSIIDGISVYDARYKMGQLLAKKIQTTAPNIDTNIDLILPVPESSLIFALGLQSVLQIPMHYALVKNPYIERTFIMKNDEVIQKSIKRKLNFVRQVVENKNILIVDDSIVRGNTSSHIVQMAKKAGAKNIYFTSGSPPIINTNHYGIYIPTREELVAVNRSDQDIANVLGATQVIYNDLDAIVTMLKTINPYIRGFETSIWGVAPPIAPCSPGQPNGYM